MIFYAVGRTDVEEKNTDNLRDFRDRIAINDNLCRQIQGHVEISISGYDEDLRELFEIPEVVEWFEMADEVFRDWFFFLNTALPAAGLRSYVTCLCAPEVKKRDFKKSRVLLTLDMQKMNSLFKKNFVRLNELTERLGLSIEKNKEITYAVFDVFKIPHGD